MNEINYITLKRHGWTDKLIEKFNLHPTSYNIRLCTERVLLIKKL